MKTVQYALIALFSLCLTNVSFAATEDTSSKPVASAKPACGCQGKGAQSNDQNQSQSTPKSS